MKTKIQIEATAPANARPANVQSMAEYVWKHWNTLRDGKQGSKWVAEMAFELLLKKHDGVEGTASRKLLEPIIELAMKEPDACTSLRLGNIVGMIASYSYTRGYCEGLKYQNERYDALMQDGQAIGEELQMLTGYESGIDSQKELNSIYAASDFA